jgi:hypothetical protein
MTPWKPWCSFLSIFSRRQQQCLPKMLQVSRPSIAHGTNLGCELLSHVPSLSTEVTCFQTVSCCCMFPAGCPRLSHVPRNVPFFTQVFSRFFHAFHWPMEHATPLSAMQLCCSAYHREYIEPDSVSNHLFCPVTTAASPRWACPMLQKITTVLPLKHPRSGSHHSLNKKRKARWCVTMQAHWNASWNVADGEASMASPNPSQLCPKPSYIQTRDLLQSWLMPKIPIPPLTRTCSLLPALAYLLTLSLKLARTYMNLVGPNSVIGIEKNSLYIAPQ